MESLNLILNLLEEKLTDLQRDTKFCVNNYDYHHKNNEHQIIQNLQGILKDSLLVGKEFINSMETIRSSMTIARKKCDDIDELLEGYKSEASNNVGGSFHEEQVIGKNFINVLEENKENTN